MPPQGISHLMLHFAFSRLMMNGIRRDVITQLRIERHLYWATWTGPLNTNTEKDGSIIDSAAVKCTVQMENAFLWSTAWVPWEQWPVCKHVKWSFLWPVKRRQKPSAAACGCTQKRASCHKKVASSVMATELWAGHEHNRRKGPQEPN